MGMGRHDKIETRHPAPQQMGSYDKPAGIEPGMRASGIDENGSLPLCHKHAVSLSDTDEIETERLIMLIYVHPHWDCRNQNALTQTMTHRNWDALEKNATIRPQ